MHFWTWKNKRWPEVSLKPKGNNLQKIKLQQKIIVDKWSSLECAVWLKFDNDRSIGSFKLDTRSCFEPGPNTESKLIIDRNNKSSQESSINSFRYSWLWSKLDCIFRKAYILCMPNTFKNCCEFAHSIRNFVVMLPMHCLPSPKIGRVVSSSAILICSLLLKLHSDTMIRNATVGPQHSCSARIAVS